MEKEIRKILLKKKLLKEIIDLIIEYAIESYFVCLTYNFKKLNNSPKLKFIKKLNYNEKICKLFL